MSAWIVRPADAHAGLVRSEPAAGAQLAEPPAQIILWFDEELDTRASAFEVLGADGRAIAGLTGRVDLHDPDHARMIAAAPPLPDGLYAIHWRVVTVDDEGMTEGKFQFGVGHTALAAPKPQPDRTNAWGWSLCGAGAALGLALATWRRPRKG